MALNYKLLGPRFENKNWKLENKVKIMRIVSKLNKNKVKIMHE